jgi:hypothetical protein
MKKDKRIILFFIGFLLSQTFAGILLYFLFSANLEAIKQRAEWVTTFLTLISTLIIGATAYWAKKSVWYTEEKERNDLTMTYIEKLSDPEFLNGMISLGANRIKDLRVYRSLSLLEMVGVLWRENKIDKKLIYEFTKINFTNYLPGLLEAITDEKEKNSEAWSNAFYLGKEIEKFNTI